MGDSISLPGTKPAAAEAQADPACAPALSLAQTALTPGTPSWAALPVAPAVWILAVLALIASLYIARAFFVPLLIGVLVSYMLRPLVDGLEKRHIPRAIAAAAVLAVLAGSLGWVGFSLRDDAQKMLDKLPETARKLRQSINAARSAGPTPLQQVQKAANELQRAAAEATGAARSGAVARTASEPPAFAWLNNYLLTQSTLIIAVIAQAPLVLLLIYFLLASGEHFRRKLLTLAGPSLSSKKVTLGILHEIDAQIQRYMLATLATNILTALGTWLAFELMGLHMAGLWGVAAGVLHFIPYLGPALVALASGLAGFIQFESFPEGIAVAGASLLVSGLAGLLFMPWLQSRFSGINAAVLFIVLLFFGWLWGAWGLLLGAPLLAIFKVICDRIVPLQPLGELIGR